MEQSYEKFSVDIAKGMKRQVQSICRLLTHDLFVLVFPSTKISGLHTISGRKASSSVP
jgi:hypothetical protein